MGNLRECFEFKNNSDGGVIFVFIFVSVFMV